MMPENFQVEVQQHNREFVTLLFLEGKERMEMAATEGVHYGVVCRWIHVREVGGDKAIELKK